METTTKPPLYYAVKLLLNKESYEEKKEDNRNVVVEFVFEMLPRVNDEYPEHILNWNSLYKNQHPIRIISINGKMSNECAIAHTSKLYGEDILRFIYLHKMVYVTPSNLFLLYPTGKQQIQNDTLYLHFGKECDLNSALVKMDECATPFMDFSGTFHYMAKIISRDYNVSSSILEKDVTDATLFQYEGKFQSILDHGYHHIYPIQYIKTIKRLRMGKPLPL